MPELNPHAALVEALRKTNGWTQTPTEDEWACASNDCPDEGCDGTPPMKSHDKKCRTRLALEYTPPPTPKLTPLPDVPDHQGCMTPCCYWLERNREAIEFIIAQQEQPMPEQHNTNTTPTYADIERLEKRIEERFDSLDNRVSDIQDHLSETYKSESLSSPESPDNSKPKCRLCNDTKIEHLIHLDGRRRLSLCPCVKVGDEVTAEVANLLPVGSRVAKILIGEYWERTAGGWIDETGHSHSDGVLKCSDWPILRIGPAPASTTDHIADASKMVDKAEEIARECLEVLQAHHGEDLDHRIVAGVLRKHGVGQLPPLADMIADPRLRPMVEILQLRIKQYQTGTQREYGELNAKICGLIAALPHALRSAVEAVK